MRNNSHSRGKDTNKYVSEITVSIIYTIEKPDYGLEQIQHNITINPSFYPLVVTGLLRA